MNSTTIDVSCNFKLLKTFSRYYLFKFTLSLKECVFLSCLIPDDDEINYQNC